MDPFSGVDHVYEVTSDGRHIWTATGDKLNAFDPASGKVLRSIGVAAHVGTAFEGQCLFQIAEDRIQKINPKTGRVLATIPEVGRPEFRGSSTVFHRRRSRNAPARPARPDNHATLRLHDVA